MTYRPTLTPTELQGTIRAIDRACGRTGVLDLIHEAIAHGATWAQTQYLLVHAQRTKGIALSLNLQQSRKI